MQRVRVQHSGDTTGPGLSTFYGGGSTSGDAATLHAAVASFWNSVRGLMVSYSSIIIESEVPTIDPETGNITGMNSVDQITYSGAVADQQLPAATQALVRWRTGVYNDGREVRGRTFIPGPCESHSDNARPNTAYKNALQTAVNALDTNLVIWSRPRKDAEGNITRPGFFEICTFGTVWSEWAVLRSRRD